MRETRDPFKILRVRKENHLRTRDVSIPFRVTEKELQEIDKRAEKAKLDRTNYLITCALNKKITVLEDLKPLLSELKRIGNNLNQLTKLSNMGQIKTVDLYETRAAIDALYGEIFRIARTKDGDN